MMKKQMPVGITVESDGLLLAVETHGTGGDIVFAHGLSSNRDVTWRQLRPLSRGRRIVTFDQRGHGSSSKVLDPALYDPGRMAGDIGAVMDALGISSAVVGGESMGSATALVFALRNPGRVKALLLTAPAFGDSPNSESGDLYASADLLEKVGMKAFLEISAEEIRKENILPPEAIRFLTRFRRVHDAASLAIAFRTVIGWIPFGDLSVLEKLTCPVCIQCWPGDPLHPVILAERMAGIFPHATLVRLPSIVDIFVDPPSVGRGYLPFLKANGL